MKSDSSRSRGLICALLATAAVTVLGLPAVAAAQDEVAAGDENTENQVEALIVTGSRIPRPEIDFPNPITSVGSENIVQSGQTNLTDLLTQIPALVGSSTSADNAGSNALFGTAGLNLLNLRNFGEDRTLVLVDGRRHVPGLAESAAVDINTIPVDLIERVDVLTGGVSAIYGADGVSGVVNFVMKKDFEGIAARTQGGQSEHGDAGNRFFSVTMGKNFADNRGNVAAAFEYSKDERLSTFDRPRLGDPLQSFGLQRNQNDIPDDCSASIIMNGGTCPASPIPDRIPYNDLRYTDSSPDGALDVDFDLIPDFTGTGAVYDRGNILVGTPFTQGGSSTPAAGYQGDVLPENMRQVFNLLGHYDFSDRFKMYAQAKYARTSAFTFSQPTFDFFTTMQPDNPFIPANVAAVAPAGLYMSRDNFDLGTRGDEIDRRTWRGVFGVEGALTDHLNYDISLVYGQSSIRNTSLNDRLADRYYAALDAVIDPLTGQPTCRSNLQPGLGVDPFGDYPFISGVGTAATTFTPGPNSGCVPLNLFGVGVADPRAVEWVTVDSVNRFRIDQTVLTAAFNGDLGAYFELPAGPVGYAFGAEYRRESAFSDPSSFIQNGFLLDSSQILADGGKFGVTEAFAEVNVPILKDMRFANLFTVGGAIRLSDYTTVGSTKTWQLNTVYAPTKDFRFRGTYSHAVRAPNIGELFSARSGTFEFIDDPCDMDLVNSGSSFRVANCNAILSGFGVDPTTFSPSTDPNQSTSILGTLGGNPNLQEETANTWTAGVVFNPSFLKSLRVSLDWYDIKLENAIAAATPQELAELCVDEPTLNNSFCPSITRDPTTGYISTFDTGPSNVAQFETAGGELTVNYAYDHDRWGRFNLHFVGAYLDKLTFVNSPGADPDNDLRESGSPKWQATADLTWSYNKWTVNYGLNWFDKTRRFTVEELAGQPDLTDPRYFWYKAKWESDIYASYAVNDMLEYYAGVNNLFDNDPALYTTNYPNTEVGRFFYVGARLKLADVFR